MAGFEGERLNSVSVDILCTVDTDLPPACAKFSRHDPSCLVVGTYLLKNGDRHGSLVLYRLVDDELIKLQDLAFSFGILDVQFAPVVFQDIFAAASSSGKISVFRVTHHGSKCSMEQIGGADSFLRSELILSLAWHPQYTNVIGVTLSSSLVALLEFTNDYKELTVLDIVNEHDTCEAWKIAFAPNIVSKSPMFIPGIYSGGDDSCLRISKYPVDKAPSSHAERPSVSPRGFSSKKTGHNAGVTAILPLPLGFEAGEDILLTGSFDQFIRVYALRDHRPGKNSKKPQVMAELDLGGGVWRLNFLRDYSLQQHPVTRLHEEVTGDEAEKGKQERKGGEERKGEEAGKKDESGKEDQEDAIFGPLHTYRVMASCMHAGASIVQITGRPRGEWSITVLAKFTEHQELTYGGDVQPVPEEKSIQERLDDKSVVCLSTTFYNKKVSVWRYTREPANKDTGLLSLTEL